MRYVIQYCFKKDNNTNDTTDEICTVYESGTTTITVIRNWFKRFRIDNFDLKDEGRSGPLAMSDMDLIKVSENP